MATQEKLLKSLEGLQYLVNQNYALDSQRKEKIQHCHFITDAITSSTIKIAPNYNHLLSFTFEVLLELCGDQESDVRMIADESLNKIIRALSNGNIGKVQVELHKEIKKNSKKARSLKAALWRFANLADMIRPHKGRPYVVNLVPCIVKISERQEDFIHDSLASNLPKILNVLGCFTNDGDIKMLLNAFLKNISDTSPVIRRHTAQCLLTTCLNSRKPLYFLVHTLNNLVDFLVPTDKDASSLLILGVLNGIKIILPNLIPEQNSCEMTNSLGLKKEISEVVIPVDRLIQVYELCLFFLSYNDHNVINMALETLNILLLSCQPDLKEALLSNDGITQSRITNLDSDTKKGSPYEMSIASSRNSEENLLESLSDPLGQDIEKWIDQSKLSVINVNYVSESRSVDSVSLTSDVLDTTNNSESDIQPSEDSTNEKANTLKEGKYDVGLSRFETASETDYSCLTEDTGSIMTLTDLISQHFDIGNFNDSTVPLIYCTRLIAKSFLLSSQPNDLIPDRNVRVSVKNLALTCLSSVFQLHPDVLLLPLDKNESNEHRQMISDVLLYEDHSDPQLRGIVRTAIASFLLGVFQQTSGRYSDWLNARKCDNNLFGLENMVKLLVKGLENDSSTCVRQSLSSLNLCFKQMLHSPHCSQVLPILSALPALARNPYWLVKVKLLEVVAEFEYLTIEYVTENQDFQNKIIHNVLLELLRDEDQRVRSATSNAIVKIIPSLYFQQQTPNQGPTINKAIAYRNLYLKNLQSLEVDCNVTRRSFLDNMPFPLNVSADSEIDGAEFGLSRIIIRLHEMLLSSTEKHVIYGCLETLSLLSQHYPCTVYKTSWNCFKNYNFSHEKSIFQRSNSIIGNISTICESTVSSSKDLLNISVSLLSNVIVHDLNCHTNLLKFCGNIFAGKSLENLQLSDINQEGEKPLWDMFNDKTLRDLSEAFLNHVVKLLNVFAHVIDEVTPVIIQPKPVLPNLPPASTLSPLKRRKSDLDKSKLLIPGRMEKEDRNEKRIDLAKNMGYFAHVPHYMKIYEILKIAYVNYKVTLDASASENFLTLLKTTVLSLCQILEVATLAECGRVAEEVLNYLRATFFLDPTSTVDCVHQLLKSLFSTNLTLNMDSMNFKNKNDQEKSFESGFYFNMFQQPYTEFSSYIQSLNQTGKVDCDSDSVVMGYLHHKEIKKPIPKGSDKILANYIRIFEPMVIKSLKQYTITSNVKLQCKVLQLLSQLVQLRVNYCLLDSEQIFIGFVLKQFEYIEEGQIPHPEELIPKIFQFLVHLSYGKHHSKSIIGVPKIIQLCDGLMASGQNPIYYCIPALEPIVEDIFLVRNKANTTDFKELETTREVLLSMLLRLIEHKQVTDLLVIILNESKYCDNGDKWQKWSKQVFDVILTMIRLNKVRLDDTAAMESILRLLFVLNPSVYYPINDVLIVLFQRTPSNDDSITVVNRYLGKVIVILLILTQCREDRLLLKISESLKDFSPGCIFENIVTTPDPLNVLNNLNYFEGIPPDVIFVRLIFRIFEISTTKCLESPETMFLAEQLLRFSMVCLYFFQSGTHCKITNTAIKLTNSETKEKGSDLLGKTNENFTRLANRHPILTTQWCFLLIILNYDDNSFWRNVINSKNQDRFDQKEPLHLNISKMGSSIAYCEYLTDNLKTIEQLKEFIANNVHLIVDLCDEIPVNELISTVHRNSEVSLLFVDAIAEKLPKTVAPSFLLKILKCVENVHSLQTGRLIELLVVRFLKCQQLSLQRMAGNLASRKVEYLLTLTAEEVVRQMSREKLIEVMGVFKDKKLAKKNEGLVSILNKLSTHFYNLAPMEFDQRKPVDPESIKVLEIDKSWFLNQIKSKCYEPSLSSEIAELLCKLDYSDVVEVMSGKDFNKHIFRDIFTLTSKQEDLSVSKAAVDVLLKEMGCLIKMLPKKHEVYKPFNRIQTETEQIYQETMTNLFSDCNFWTILNDLMPSVTSFIQHRTSNLKIPEDIAKFSVVSLESILYLITRDKTDLNVHFVNQALHCAEVILKHNLLVQVLSSTENISLLCSAVNVIYRLVLFLLLDFKPLPTLSKNGLDGSNSAVGDACYQLFVLIAWIESCVDTNIPSVLYKPIKSVVVSLGRLCPVNSYVLTPPSAWKNGWKVEFGGAFKTQVPALPVDYMQEIETLEEFIYRVTLLGWNNRQQFEETWMCLLSVLSFNPNGNKMPEEANTLAHATGLAVSAITSLLVLTMYEPNPGNRNNSKLLHISRDSVIDDNSTSIKKLKIIQSNFLRKFKQSSDSLDHKDIIANVFEKPNLEKQRPTFSVGQISVAYLLVSAKIAEPVNDNDYAVQLNNNRRQILSESGLDLNSCVQFLLDLYSQWLNDETPPALRVLNEVIKSVLIISDLFLEKSQFEWMLRSSLELSKTHAGEDEILHQYLIVNLCKAAAVLNPDLEKYEIVKKSLIVSLKSSFLSMRIGSLQGLLYILEGCVLSNTVIGDLSEELQLFLPMVVEYIRCNINTTNNVLLRSQDHCLLLWSIAFFIIENVLHKYLPEEFIATTIQSAIGMLNSQKQTMVVHNAVMKGLERLIIKKCLPRKLHEQTTKLALEKLKDNNPVHALAAAQLLISCMYIECEDQLQDTEKSNGIVQTTPDNLVQTIEKVSAIFDKIKKGNPFEVEILCSILPNIINDFFVPSDILTKVVGEFLSHQQNHPKLLSRVVFQVFESGIKQNQLSLLQDWVVFSLSNFTQSFSVGMATWCLTCFFISASTNDWLRSFFPYVQSRIGRYEYEDKMMLCITGSDFYRNLTTDTQRKTFVDTFTKVKDQIDMPFNDLLASL